MQDIDNKSVCSACAQRLLTTKNAQKRLSCLIVLLAANQMSKRLWYYKAHP